MQHINWYLETLTQMQYLISLLCSHHFTTTSCIYSYLLRPDIPRSVLGASTLTVGMDESSFSLQISRFFTRFVHNSCCCGTRKDRTQAKWRMCTDSFRIIQLLLLPWSYIHIICLYSLCKSILQMDTNL